MNNPPAVSVIIPVFNGEKILPEFFAALKLQDLEPDEIIVSDSESDDQTVALCKSAGAKIVDVSRNDFDHGGTRSMLAQMAKNNVIVFFTQDAVLADKKSLRNIVEALMQDETIGCAYGRQLPALNATLMSAHLRSFNYPSRSYTRDFEDRVRFGLKTVFISNSFAAYKKTVLAEHSYFKNGLIFGEDTCTLGRLLLAGYKVAYVAEASVYHSHNYQIAEEFQRSFDIGVLHSSERWLLETYGGAEGIGGNYVKSALKEILSKKEFLLIPDWLLRNIAKFVGYKLGRAYLKLPVKLRPRLSLHSHWW